MKKRKNFHKIIVEGQEFQYIWSWPPSQPPHLIVYDEKSVRYSFRISSDDIPDNPKNTWFGKHSYSGRGAHCIGMWEANHFIKKLILDKKNDP